ncbi:transcriptional regulator [Cellulomonas xylanilytica]|uniref:Transcriptional regulator n=1 Tax=Cellulomonas xylanilytica TaxID=233583 RepID=A0A510UY82_9CELL|nr:transcriptional regulator [Cellulomonas xylanilytica]
MLVPVLIDQHGRIIDGHHRSRIADELGVRYQPVVHVVDDDEHAAAIAREVNLHRRHMDPEQRRAVVVALAEQGHSQVAIAEALKIGRGTLQRDIEGAHVGTLPDYVTAKDGKSYPRTLRPLTPHEARTEMRRAELAAQRLDYEPVPSISR